MEKTIYMPTHREGSWRMLNYTNGSISAVFSFSDYTSMALVCAAYMGMTVKEAQLIWDQILYERLLAA